MLLSIILPTKNNERTIGKCLSSIAVQSDKDIEVILIDNYSSDKTVDIAHSFKDLLSITIFQKGPERHVQRPFGFSKSSGDIIYFLDSDMYLETKVLKEIKQVFKKNADVGGVIIPEENITQNYGYWAKVKAFERSLYSNDDSVEAARAFRRKIYKELGGYNSSLISGEDWDFSDRVRKKSNIMRITSKIHHDEGRIKLVTLLKKKFYYGRKFVDYVEANGVNSAGGKVYFFRKSFYSNWKKYIYHPLLFIGFFTMINLSFISGASGYLIGKFTK